MLALAPGGKPVVIDGSGSVKYGARVSPSGRWVADTSDDSHQRAAELAGGFALEGTRLDTRGKTAGAAKPPCVRAVANAITSAPCFRLENFRENIGRGFALSSVQLGDAGINKPFDRILKAFVDEAPSLFLRLLGFIPAGAEADIQPLRPETAPAMVLPDYVAVVRTGVGEPIVFHAEFQSNYHQDVPRDMARYGGSLAWQRQMPVCSVLVTLRPDRAPAEIPEEGHYNIGSTRTTHPFKVVRLWEIDPAPVLETGNPRLLPWTLLLKSTDEQVRKIASILARQDDDEAVARFLLLGGVRYHRNALEEMLGGRKMSFTQAILDGSKIVEEIRDEERAAGRAEGFSEGQMQGQAAEARKFLLLLLRKHFPELQGLPEIQAISSAKELESIIEAVLDAGSAESIRAAILAAAEPN